MRRRGAGSQVFYDARTVAQRLAEQSGSVLVLGSATPSLESYYAAARGRYHLVTLPQRVMGHRSDAGAGEVLHAELPPVEVVDMRQELRAGQRSIFSRSLTSALLTTLDAGEQAILFLNRRGTNTFILCRDCGHVESCRNCEVPLTFHEGAGQLVCHHCNRRYPVPTVCPACQSKRIKFFGAGTERIEEAVLELAPHARVLRWDADTTGAKGSHGEILRRFVAHEADVLVGTQMIAKGLDLPLVTLVGVVAADVGLFLPDFRSGERVFQLLTQVAGRAGRSERGGRVVVQTYRPEHYAIQAAARHDYEGFYRREIQFRQEHGYPPIRRLAKLVYWDKKEDKARRAASTWRVCCESGWRSSAWPRRGARWWGQRRRSSSATAATIAGRSSCARRTRRRCCAGWIFRWAGGSTSTRCRCSESRERVWACRHGHLTTPVDRAVLPV